MNYADLKSKLRGAFIERGDAQYHEARKLYNRMIDKRPDAIARCVDAADVMACVNHAREHGMTLAVRGGGHNGPGLGSCDDGLVIDLSAMRTVRVDPPARTAYVSGGCVWADVDHATFPFGLAVPSGMISSTGVGGLTLGGGIGHLARQYGLTIDHLRAVDMVLADGSFVSANERDHPDLFWAVRGGGGNFGVVTQFTFDLAPVGMVTAGPMFWSNDDAPEVMRRYEEFITDAPREINGFFAFMVVPPAPMFPQELHMRKVCGVMWCSTAGAEETDRLLAVTGTWPKPLLRALMPLPLPVLNSLFNDLYSPGLQWYWKADFVDQLSQEAIAAHLRHGANPATMHCTMHMYPINGAVHDVSESATPFHHRKSKWAEVIVGVDPDPAKKDTIVSWARDYWDAVHPYAAGGAYVNFMMEEGSARIEATYGANYARLRRVKARYDPANLFRVNQNIQPAMAAGH